MKKIKKSSLLYLLSICFLLAALLPSCGGDEVIEPAIYAPKQLKRLLLDDATKTWQQTSEYYLEDTCRRGYLLRFQDNPTGRIDSAFFAYFIPDTSVCEGTINPEERYRVKILQSPLYKTTDSLLFVSPERDTTIKTIRLLTSQRLLLNVAGEAGAIERVEEYRAVN